MKDFWKHLFCLSWAVALILAGQACKKESHLQHTTNSPVDTTHVHDTNVIAGYAMVAHYYNKVSTASPGGPDTGAVITDSILGIDTFQVSASDTITLDGQDFVRSGGMWPDSGIEYTSLGVDRAIFYHNRDSLYWYHLTQYSGHSYSVTGYFYYGHKIF